MQNIPGLSFFDGLTRSRGQQQQGGSRSSSNPMGSPTETPLRDAAPFASLRGTSSSRGMEPFGGHPLGGEDAESDTVAGEGADTFDDPLSPAISSAGGGGGASLPAASFSRRAATISSASSPSASTLSSSPMVGLPNRRATSSSTMGRSSILSKDSIFSSPILSRRPSSIADNASTGSGRDRSGSTSSLNNKESEEPTAKDVTLMARGTQAYAMLKRIQEHPIELADIIRLLVTKKAILILPTCAVSTEEPSPTRPTYEDHVIIPESNHGESLFVTLSGIRGILKPASSSITMLGFATGQDFGTLVSDASGPTKRSFFDNIAKEEGDGLLDGAVPTNGQANDELKLVNSSKRPVVIFVESVGSIHALLVDGIIPRPKGDAAPTPIVPLASGIATFKDRSAARRTASSASSVRSMNISEDRDREKDATPLPKLPKIAADLPLEWDSVLRDLESFVIKLKKSPLNSADKYANEFQRKYDDIRHRFEVYGSASGMGHRWSDQDFDDMQQWVEAWLCREMYTTIFPQSSARGINSQDFLQDEQLQAKIAALNFLDLTLEHLGFMLDHPEDVEHIAQVVREGGVEMQKLALVKSPSDKMSVILSSHRVVVDALNREPAVQEMLIEAEEAKDASATGQETNDTSIATTTVTSASDSRPALSAIGRGSKRLSIPKIPMDGTIPRLDSSSSLVSVRSPKIPMDEGYDRPPQEEAGENENSVAVSTVLSEKKATTAETEQSGEAKEVSAAAEVVTEPVVNPAQVALPISPAPDAEAGAVMPSIVVPETIVAASTTVATAVLASTSPQRKQYSADVLLPLLIFSVVKSNPPMLISNLRYIQRFKVQDHLTGELAYCLTNMMAVVSFLETLDPQALGLSSEIRVLSDMSDIHVVPGRPNRPNPVINFQEGLDHTKALGHKVSQEIVGVAEEGIKVISDVVQDGYSKFFNRLLTAADGLANNKSGGLGGSLSRGRGMSAASSLAATAAASAAAAAAVEEEKKTKAAAAAAQGGLAAMVSPAGVTSNVTALSVDGTAAGNGGSGSIEKSSAHDSAMEAAAKRRVLDFVRGSEGPQLQFMACTDSGDLRLSDVKSLLDDYQRIGKILEEIKRLA